MLQRKIDVRQCQREAYRAAFHLADLVDAAHVGVINACLRAEGQAALTLEEMRARQLIDYIAFPDALKGKYQSYTEADCASLRSAGYAQPFLTVEEGVSRYCEQLLDAEGARGRPGGNPIPA